MRRIAVVTGANQGLGFALAEGLAQRLEPGSVVYLTGRRSERVHAAVERLADQKAEVRGHVLDVRSDVAVDAFADEIRTRHGGVDIVFSNAAARLTPETSLAELVGPFVDTNNLGTTRMLRSFGPILRPGGRLVVVASDLGSLRNLPPRLRGRFDTARITLDEIDATMLGWRDAVVEGRAAEEGWPDWINIPSKVGQVAAVRVVARERRTADARKGILVAAVSPGLVDTAAARPWFEDMSQAQIPAQAAVALLQLALDADVDGRLYGELVRFGRVIPWAAPGLQESSDGAAGKPQPVANS